MRACRLCVVFHRRIECAEERVQKTEPRADEVVMSNSSDQHFWCEYAWLGGNEPSPDVVLVVRDGKLLEVRTSPSIRSDHAVQLPGLTMPGLVNAHSHAFHRLIRSTTHRSHDDFMGWRASMYRASAELTPDSYADLAADVFTEMLLAGYTTVGEFHYLHHQPGGEPYADEHAMERAVLDAARSAGIRITLLDTCYLNGGIGQKLSEPQLRFSDGNVRTWEARVESLVRALRGRSTARLGGAIHSVRAVDFDSMSIVSRWASGRSLPLHAHVSEIVSENEDCERTYAKSPTALLHAAGAMRSDRMFTAVHATNVSQEDMRTLGRSRSFVACCPTTERELADGISPTYELVGFGSQLCIGSDSQAIIDPFEELRGIEMHQRLASRQRGRHSVQELLDAGTVNGHQALGWNNVGRIQPGMLADFITIDTTSPRFRGIAPKFLLDAAIFAGGASDVHHVVVNGEVVVRDRHPVRRQWRTQRTYQQPGTAQPGTAQPGPTPEP
jgi:formiminoglutamate deiminase